MVEKSKLATTTSKKTIALDEKRIQLVIAHVGGQDFGARIDQVREVIRYKHITAIPDSAPFIAGIASFHGEMALVIDLARYFSISDEPNKQAKHIIVIRHGKELYGLLVDEVSQIIRVPESSIKAAPDLIHHINSDYISGVYAENEERLIMIFNLNVILSEDELMMLSDVKQRHLNKSFDNPTPDPTH